VSKRNRTKEKDTLSQEPLFYRACANSLRSNNAHTIPKKERILSAIKGFLGLIGQSMGTVPLNPVQKARRATKPSKSAKWKRTDSKTQRGKLKALRKNMSD